MPPHRPSVKPELNPILMLWLHATEATKVLEDSKGCFVDIMLKDIQTAEGEPERLCEWVRITREVAEDYA